MVSVPSRLLLDVLTLSPPCVLQSLLVSSIRVNVDVDVPLFMPLHGQRRLADLRYTAQQEQEHDFRITGQVNFESGWEFGYYLSNAVTARAIWNPRVEVRPSSLATHLVAVQRHWPYM